MKINEYPLYDIWQPFGVYLIRSIKRTINSVLDIHLASAIRGCYSSRDSDIMCSRHRRGLITIVIIPTALRCILRSTPFDYQ